MGVFDLFLIGVGLSMDAFAVAICKGLGMHRINYRHTLVIALFFGGFQALMPLIGYFLGSYLADLVNPIDHWIAFVLLAFIGAKMLVDAFKGDEGEDAAQAQDKLDLKELLMLAVATSIDALAVGITFAFLEVNIWVAITVIGLTTFVLSLVGVAVGNRFGARYEKPSTVAGGIVLILIGLKILLEHLGVIAF